jgi:hypothetical protein
MTTKRLDEVSMGEVFAFTVGGCRYRKLTRAGEARQSLPTGGTRRTIRARTGDVLTFPTSRTK